MGKISHHRKFDSPHPLSGLYRFGVICPRVVTLLTCDFLISVKRPLFVITLLFVCMFFLISAARDYNQNYIKEEIKCRHKAGNSCYYSVQTLLFSRLPSKILKKIYI